MNNKIESVLYVRSANSSKKSLDIQKLVGEKYAKQNSIPLSIIEDTQSADCTSVNESTGLQSLIHLLEVGKVKRVIVTCLTRISRNVKELHYIQSLFEKHDAKLVVIDKGGLSSK